MLSKVERSVVSSIDPERTVSWVQELVRIPSVPRPGLEEVETGVARWLDGRCRELGLETHVELAAPGRPNVIAILPGGSHERTLMFEGHTDVVSEGDHSNWHRDPFSGEITEGRIYGRGANDMKGGLAAALSAIAALRESGVELSGDILFGALADEEGMMRGVKDFVRRGWAQRVTAAIICEPEDNRLCIAQKGVMWIDVRWHGRMAHGAMPDCGVNPISYMAAFLTQVGLFETEEKERRGRDEFLGTPSLTPTRVHAPLTGEAETNNLIPATCQATLDIRLLPGQSPDAVQEELLRLMAATKEGAVGLDGELRVLEARPPTFTSRDEPLVRVMDGAWRDLFGNPPEYGGVPGSTDGTILNTQAGIPVVTCGPGGTQVPHQADEYLEIEQLLDATRLYAVTALRFLKADGGTPRRR